MAGSERLKAKRILLVTPVWKGSLGFFCLRALQQMGHDAQAFDYRVVAYGSNEYRQQRAGALQIIRNKLGLVWMNYMLQRKVEEFAPDVVLVIKGEIIEAHTIKQLTKQGGAALALWYPDPSRELSDRSERRMAAGMRWYDVTFVCDPTHLPEALKPNIRRLDYLTFACDPEFHRPVAVTEEERTRLGGTVCFVGNWQGATSPRYELLRQLHGQPVNVWGYGWQNSDLAAQGINVMNQAVYGDEMLKVYSSNLIALNFNFDRYINFRNFEVPACGPLMITTAVPGLDEYFRPDEEVITFDTPDELRAKVDYYVRHPEIAARIGARGQQRAHREHTFAQRMAEMLEKVARA